MKCGKSNAIVVECIFLQFTLTMCGTRNVHSCTHNVWMNFTRTLEQAATNKTRQQYQYWNESTNQPTILFTLTINKRNTSELTPPYIAVCNGVNLRHESEHTNSIKVQHHNQWQSRHCGCARRWQCEHVRLAKDKATDICCCLAFLSFHIYFQTSIFNLMQWMQRITHFYCVQCACRVFLHDHNGWMDDAEWIVNTARTALQNA